MNKIDLSQAKTRIRTSRERSHLLKESEFRTIEYLCPRIPQWVTPDILTLTGISGAVVVYIGLFLATSNKLYLLLSVVGFAIHWFGDSLDGRLAYFRNIPRKWYGWSLDINADWISICVIGLGFYHYFTDYKVVAFIFVVAYGGSMILSLLQYKINNRYVIDKAAMGPTELRIIISIVMIVEIFVPSTLIIFAAIASAAMLFLNAKESLTVMHAGDMRDLAEKEKRSK